MEHILIARDVNIRISKVGNVVEPIVASQSNSLVEDVKASCMKENLQDELNQIKNSETEPNKVSLIIIAAYISSRLTTKHGIKFYPALLLEVSASMMSLFNCQ